MHWYAGTSGYGCRRWIGHFYPDGIKSDAMLAYYAVHLPAVEIESTFQRLPRARILEGWADAVPADFRFAIKAPRSIIHQDAGTGMGTALSQLTHRLDALDGKLGAVRFQWPHGVGRDIVGLRRFANALPRQLPAAIEFQHPSWFAEDVYDLLSRHGIALCIDDATRAAECTRIATAGWVYLRHGRGPHSDATLLGSCRQVQAAAVEQAFAFFTTSDDDTGPDTAARFLRMSQESRRGVQPPRRAARRGPAATKPPAKGRA